MKKVSFITGAGKGIICTSEKIVIKAENNAVVTKVTKRKDHRFPVLKRV